MSISGGGRSGLGRVVADRLQHLVREHLEAEEVLLRVAGEIAVGLGRLGDRAQSAAGLLLVALAAIVRFATIDIPTYWFDESLTVSLPAVSLVQ